MNTAELVHLVRAHWSPPAFHVIEEVRNGTGYGRAEGYADILAMSVFPSRGLELIGAELKVSRSDWLKEKRDPAKADKFFKHCHRWYLITGPGVIQAEDEIPAAWGWMQAGPKGLKTMKAAPSKEPQLPDWCFLASIFRNIGRKADDMVPKSMIHQFAAEQSANALAGMRTTLESETARHKQTAEELNALRSAVEHFNQISGCDLRSWHPVQEQYGLTAARFREFRTEQAQANFDAQLKEAKRRALAFADEVDRIHSQVEISPSRV